MLVGYANTLITAMTIMHTFLYHSCSYVCVCVSTPIHTLMHTHACKHTCIISNDSKILYPNPKGRKINWLHILISAWPNEREKKTYQGVSLPIRPTMMEDEMLVHTQEGKNRNNLGPGRRSGYEHWCWDGENKEFAYRRENQSRDRKDKVTEKEHSDMLGDRKSRYSCNLRRDFL